MDRPLRQLRPAQRRRVLLRHVSEGDHNVAHFIIQVSLYGAEDDWTVPTFLPHLRKDIGDAAAAGKTNTIYTAA